MHILQLYMAFLIIEKMTQLEYNLNMSNFNKKLVVFACSFASFGLFACQKGAFYSDVQKDIVKIPIVSIDKTNVLDIDNISKMDSNSLIPAPIKKGSEHQIVTTIQARLMELGFMEEDKATSYFGDSTEDAIKKFERQLGFPIDGICSLEVYSALMAKNAPTYEVKRGYQGDDIKILQQQLYELSYLLYEDDVNGFFGKKTEIAVKEMQKSNNLAQTGAIDIETLNFLYSENVKAYTITNKSDPSIIKTYQIKLRDLGYYFGECNGFYGDDFRMAVRVYQLNNSQLSDGFIGPSTKFSLDSKYARPFSLFLGQRNRNVKLIQDKLVALNYLEESQAKGYYGEFTAQAVALFQQNNGLEVTGAVNGETNRVLNSEEALPSTEGPIKYVKQFVINTIEMQKKLEQTQNIGNVEDLLKVSMLKLGSKYVWGSRGPNTFDCSGFVFWCLNQVGVNINYMTTYNWRFCTQFERVEKFEDLIPGDLLVINGHMGIVSENETIVDASSSNGKVVHRDLDEWWRERFIIGFRIFSGDGQTTEG